MTTGTTAATGACGSPVMLTRSPTHGLSVPSLSPDMRGCTATRWVISRPRMPPPRPRHRRCHRGPRMTRAQSASAILLTFGPRHRWTLVPQRSGGSVAAMPLVAGATMCSSRARSRAALSAAPPGAILCSPEAVICPRAPPALPWCFYVFYVYMYVSYRSECRSPCARGVRVRLSPEKKSSDAVARGVA